MEVSAFRKVCNQQQECPSVNVNDFNTMQNMFQTQNPGQNIQSLNQNQNQNSGNHLNVQAPSFVKSKIEETTSNNCQQQ